MVIMEIVNIKIFVYKKYIIYKKDYFHYKIFEQDIYINSYWRLWNMYKKRKFSTNIF